MKKKNLIIAAGLLLCGAGIGLTAFYNIKKDLVYSEVFVEAGTSDCDISEFLKREEPSARFTKKSVFDPNVPGDYKLKISWRMPIFGKQISSTVLHVKDTTAPEVTLAKESIEMYTSGVAPTVEELVASVNDISECSVEFAEDYDFSTEGEFDVSVVAKDTSGNEKVSKIPCKVVEDNTPPIISGVEPLVVAQGDAVSYKKNIQVVDDKDSNPNLQVDTTEVNLDKRGIYNLTYIATDAAGNSGSATTTIQIVSAKIEEATEETVNAMADEILAEIITEDMGQLQQAKAVFDWVVKNISYSETAGIDDLWSAAYKGMHYRIGDCTVKQKTAEVMLNRLGIKNMEIEKIRDKRGHYWLLIDVGEGWYHYDPNLQLDGTLIFYWHDADLWEYSNAHKNTHNYDPTKYPTIQ